MEYAQAAGSGHEMIAAAEFDPGKATAAVLDHVKRSDKYWGTEVEYAVAERALFATHGALCASLIAEGAPALAAIQATREKVMA